MKTHQLIITLAICAGVGVSAFLAKKYGWFKKSPTVDIKINLPGEAVDASITEGKSLVNNPNYFGNKGIAIIKAPQNNA
jgi:hypothetical protein